MAYAEGVATIQPIHADANRPFWSIMIPTYNDTTYLPETLNSVLSQDPGAAVMQIEVVDDYSEGSDVRECVRHIAGDRVTFYRQPRRVGATANYNTCVQRARGLCIHILHSDDTVRPGFYQRLAEPMEQQEEVGAAFCRCQLVDEWGREKGLTACESESASILSDYIERLVVTNRITAPGIVVRRAVYEALGGFCCQLIHSADWEMWRRIALTYPLWYEPRPLACYRVHSGSDTSRLMRTGANIADARKSIAIIQPLLPPDSSAQWTRAANEWHARFALRVAKLLLIARHGDGAVAQIREGLACARETSTIRALVETLSRAASTARKRSLRANGQLRDAVRDARRTIAELWLKLSDGDVEREYLGDLGKAHRILTRSDLPATWSRAEEDFVQDIVGDLEVRHDPQRVLQRFLVASLYVDTSSLLRNRWALDRRAASDSAQRRPLLKALRRLVDWAAYLRLATILTTERIRHKAQRTVALCVHAYHPQIGGSELHVRAIAKGLRLRGYRPIVLTPRSWADPFIVDGIPVLGDRRILRFCDVVLTYSATEMTMAVGRYLQRMDRRCTWIHHPCAVSRHGLNLIESSDRVLAFNRWDVELAKLVCGDQRKITHIYPAADRRGSRDDFRKRFIREPYIVWVGAWSPAKGVENLSVRFTLFRNRHKTTPLKLVMFGGYGDSEFPIAHPDISVIAGNEDDVHAALRDCLFVVFNSPHHPIGYDANPLILLEALMYGKTFVAQAGTPLVSEISHLGLVVKHDLEWLEAVEKLVFDPALRQRLERTCRDAYRNKYNFEQMMNGLVRTLDETVRPAKTAVERRTRAS